MAGFGERLSYLRGYGPSMMRQSSRERAIASLGSLPTWSQLPPPVQQERDRPDRGDRYRAAAAPCDCDEVTGVRR